MIRFLLSTASNLVMSGIALLLCHWWLPEDMFGLEFGGFLVAVAVFVIAQAILAPFVFNMARRYASALLGGIGLVATFLALWVASLFQGGVTVHGLGWVLAPLIIWIVTALGGWIIVGVFVERYLAKRDREKLIRKVTPSA